ncbi:MAG: DUF1887 family protein [Rhodopirellula sp.]|nr:DUF1887 family protein [Rhodopirellula sp.]
MRVLLCLLSDQHVPNLLSIHHYRPDRLVLVESAAMQRREVAANLLAALELGGLDYRDQAGVERVHIEPLEAEDDLDAVRRTLRRAYGRYPGAEWIVNVTGGTKPMSIATFDFFAGLIRRDVLSGRLVYTNVSRPARIIDLENHTTEECSHRLSTRQFLAGYGFESRKADAKLDEGESRARAWWDCARTIARHAGSEPLLALNDEDRKRSRDKGLTLRPEHFRTNHPETVNAIAECLSLEKENGVLAGRLDKYGVQFLTGGWLEVFLWGLLERAAGDLGIWDVRLGLEVGRKGDTVGNDFDVSFMRAHGLCMVECKSGSQGHDPGGDILYKMEAVTRQFRALRVQSWLATTSDNVLDARSGQLKSNIATRAEIYHCRLVLREQIAQLAAAPDDRRLLESLASTTSTGI